MGATEDGKGRARSYFHVREGETNVREGEIHLYEVSNKDFEKFVHVFEEVRLYSGFKVGKFKIGDIQFSFFSNI